MNSSLPRISIVGLGKLGSPMAAVMAAKGFHVVGVDLNRTYVDSINEGVAPIQEPRLQELINKSEGRLRATTDFKAAVAGSDVSFIIVPTPSDPNRRFSNRYVLAAVEEIGRALRDKVGRHVVVITSTVMPGSTGGEICRALEASSGREVGDDLGLAYNPEFIALGSVVRDMLEPDFLLIGESDTRTGDLLEDIYNQTCENNHAVCRMNFVNAELAKIAVNTFVTTKISYANMLSEMCECLPEANVDVVTAAIGRDSRIGGKYLKGGIGYGGPCFPRDNKAFAALAKQLGTKADLAEATDTLNDRQVGRLAARISRLARAGEKVAILGLAYKPETHVVEESQAVALANQLSRQGYVVSVHDSNASETSKDKLEDDVSIASDLAACVKGASLVIPMLVISGYREPLVTLLNRAGHEVTLLDPWRVHDPEAFGSNVTLVFLGVGAVEAIEAPSVARRATA